MEEKQSNNTWDLRGRESCFPDDKKWADRQRWQISVGAYWGEFLGPDRWNLIEFEQVEPELGDKVTVATDLDHDTRESVLKEL